MKFHKWPIARDVREESAGDDGGRRREWTDPWRPGREGESLKGRNKRGIPNKAIQQPNQPQHPPNRRIASQTPPTQYQIEGKVLPSHQSRKQNQRCRDRVPYYLEYHNLREDL